jgi:hypothetical protein
MNNKCVLILKPPGGKDIFFGHHTVHIRGSAPGKDNQQWVQKDITFLPVAVIVTVPADVQGHFSMKCTIENKFNGDVIYKSIGLLYLDIATMKNSFKVAVLRRT